MTEREERTRTYVLSAVDSIHTEGQAGAEKVEIASRIEEATGLFPNYRMVHHALVSLTDDESMSSVTVETADNKTVTVYRLAKDPAKLPLDAF